MNVTMGIDDALLEDAQELAKTGEKSVATIVSALLTEEVRRQPGEGTRKMIELARRLNIRSDGTGYLTREEANSRQ